MELAPRGMGSRRIATIKQFVNIPAYNWNTESSVRHLIFDSEDRVASTGEVVEGNGLAAAIIRIGRKVLIDLDEFDRWVDAHRQQTGEKASVGSDQSETIVKMNQDDVGLQTEERLSGRKLSASDSGDGS